MINDDLKKQMRVTEEGKLSLVGLGIADLIYNADDLCCPIFKKAYLDLQKQVYIHLNMLMYRKDLSVEEIYNIYTDVLLVIDGEFILSKAIELYLKEKHGDKVFEEELRKRGFDSNGRIISEGKED